MKKVNKHSKGICLELKVRWSWDWSNLPEDINTKEEAIEYLKNDVCENIHEFLLPSTIMESLKVIR